VVTKENANQIVSANLIRILKEKGIKQAEVAKQCGYSRQQFNDKVRGRKNFKIFDLMNIVEAYEGIEFDDLLNEYIEV
jgi:transcriptional regulator with XRE-family HTH domain